MATLIHKPTNIFTYGVYTFLALLVIAPLLKSGYILTLDLVFTPQLRMPSSITSSYLLHAFLHVLNVGIPSQVIEKIILFSIVFLAGVGMHRLILYIDESSTVYHHFGIYVAGVLYTINPFTYDRFMAGQYNVLLGYSLLPWFIGSLYRFVMTPTRKTMAQLLLWEIIISIVSIHTIGLMIMVAVIALLAFGWKYRSNEQWRRNITKYGFTSIALFIVLSSYWLIPLLLGKGTSAHIINRFGAGDFSAFATIGPGWIGKFFNVIQLQGFWAEPRGLYTLPQAHIVTWGFISVSIILLVAGGGVSYWQKGNREIFILFVITAITATFIAVGTFSGWFARYIPLFAGYREPQKFVALIAVTYAIFTARGVSSVLTYCHEQGGKFFLTFASTFLLLLPIVWTPTMWWGFNGQLYAAQYPSDWYATNKQLDSDHSNFQTLFLPWHLYMYFNFAGRIIANPATNFFNKPVIVSDNPEFKGASLSNSTSAKQQINQLLTRASTETSLGNQLAALNVKYILLAKDDDYASYGYLDKQTDLKLISETATLNIYRNEAWRGK